MKIKAILFDLDGTLLPLDQDAFTREYLMGLVRTAVAQGYEPNKIKDAILSSTVATLNNESERTNERVFWDTLASLVGEGIRSRTDMFDEFYRTEFQKIKERVCGFEPRMKEIIELVRSKGLVAALATNPVFPMSAQLERLSWSGLCEKDFDLITSYENSHYCKPDPRYYFEICKKIDVNPKNAIMIGNDEREDMKGAFEAGLMGYLVTDCRIMAKDYYWKGQRGSFEQSLKILALI